MAKANHSCKACIWQSQNGTILDGSKSNSAWAKIIGTSETTLRRHWKHAPKDTETHTDDFLADLGIPEEAVTSRGMSVRDPLTGSWQKVAWSPNKKLLHDSLKYDDLSEALDGWRPDRVVHASHFAATPVLNASDLQIGKAMQRWGGTPETVSSARKSVQSFAGYLNHVKPKTAMLADGGDPIENVFNVSSQLVTNDIPVPEQIRVFRRLMLESIKTLAPLVEDFVYLAVPSNHGQARTGYKSSGGTVDADFGLEISYQIEDAVRENPYLGHVRFVRPESLEETAVVQLSNTELAYNHGHQSGGVFRHGEWWGRQDHGRMPGWNSDILVASHFHTQVCYQSGGGRWVVGCASSDPGSDWYTNKSGQWATRGMTSFDALDGVPMNVRIL